MLRITNISITERAAVALDKRKILTRLRPSDVFELGYIFSFANADGTPVEGFVPGYMASALERKYIGPSWALAHLPSGMEFYFLPRFKWDARERYIIDLAGGAYELYSIVRVK